MHLLTYYCNSVSIMISQMCHRCLMTFSVNHFVDVLTHHMSACVDAEGGNFECWYDCYS